MLSRKYIPHFMQQHKSTTTLNRIIIIGLNVASISAVVYKHLSQVLWKSSQLRLRKHIQSKIKLISQLRKVYNNVRIDQGVVDCRLENYGRSGSAVNDVIVADRLSSL